MILLYTGLLLLLGVAKFLVGRRAARLQTRYARLAQEVSKLASEPLYKEGNSRRPDMYQTARNQYQLGQLIQRKDRLEDRYCRWLGRSERLTKWYTAVRHWKGRKLPYTFGVLDVAGALALIDYLGVGQVVNVRNLVQVLVTWVNG
jgi:hypothetical protein